MARRSPARYLAPLALVAFAVALVLVVRASDVDDAETPAPPASAQEQGSEGATAADPEPAEPRRRRYTVKPGDTPSAIAEKTGVPLARIEELNPDIDPQLLNPGDKLRLAP